MNLAEQKRFVAHCDRYFKQSDCTVLHPVVMTPHIDVLLYQPTDILPYWKLVTMGASDYRMPVTKPQLGDRNEYIMFVDAEEDLHDKSIVDQYWKHLINVAMYPIMNQCYITYGHSLEWKPEDGEEMVGAFLEMPQLIDDVGILRCKLNLFKTAICLQVILLTREETDHLLEIGPERFSNDLYPENDAPRHFLCELHRTDRF